MGNLRKISEKTVLADYGYLKKKAGECCLKGHYEDSLSYVKAAANIAYYLNFRYADNDLESILTAISSKILEGHEEFAPEDRFVFFDSFGFDNKGLTQQYLNALIAWKADFLYILESDACIQFSRQTMQLLKGYPNCQVAVLPSRLPEPEKIKQVTKLIENYRPNKAFLHISPWSVTGVCVFTFFRTIRKYYIDLTDHTFWLGQRCCDHYIEFREYGQNVARRFRNIPEEKLLIQPYYPVEDHALKFEGFPVNTENKVIVFTGGAYYKIYGKNRKFLSIIKRILDENENVLLLIAGSGDRQPLMDFIRAYHLESRIVLLGNRHDINEVFKNIDLYLGTYPFSGGLMAQYAAVNKKNLIAYTSADLSCNFMEQLVRVPDSVRLTYTDEDEFHTEINRLIRDMAYRTEKSGFLEGSVISAQEFNSGLKQLITENRPVPAKDLEIPAGQLFGLTLETENEFLHNYYFILFSNLKSSLFRNPGLTVRFLCNMILYKKHRLFAFLTRKIMPNH